MALVSLGLDISSKKTGAAWADPASVPRFDSYRAGPSIAGEVGKGRDYGRMGAAYERWFVDLIAVVGPGRIAYEAPMQVIRKLRPDEELKTTQATVRALFGLAFLTETIAERLHIPCYELHAGTGRKAMAGTGHATKEDIMAQCKRLGWGPKNLDESDAGCVLWSMLALDKSWRPPVVRRAGMLV